MEVLLLLATCNVILGVFCGGLTTALLGQPLVIFPGAVVAPVVGALVGVDPAVAASDLAQSQTAYQADLAATSRVLNLPTILDFLK